MADENPAVGSLERAFKVRKKAPMQDTSPAASVVDQSEAMKRRASPSPQASPQPLSAYKSSKMFQEDDN